MKEAYVSFEVAKILKQKGFDWKVFHFYDEEGHLKHREGDCYSLYNWNYPTKDECGSHYCSAPTLQMACRWLREEHNILVTVQPCEVGAGVDDYTYVIYDIQQEDYHFEFINQGRMQPIAYTMDYEGTLEEGIKHVLTNLI
jgi:hypothetical protein